MRASGIKRRAKQSIHPRGTRVHAGKKRTEAVRTTMMAYDEQELTEEDVSTTPGCFLLEGKPGVTWINLDGVLETEIVDRVSDCLSIHPLVLEGIVAADQRPKLEDCDDYVFLVARMLQYDRNDGGLQAEQVSLLLGPNYVISFQERQPGDVFDPVRDRIRNARGRIRRMGADYLAYALVDAIVDSYFLVLEKIGEEIERIEDQLLTEPAPEALQTVHELKRDLIFVRKSVWPLREVISNLERGESPLIGHDVLIYLRDLYSHTIEVIDTVETFRDMISAMLDIYLSSLSYRMNEIMKVLTIIATIFIPLTFITGVYGMNFRYMPEIGWRWGYAGAWAAILCTVAAMLIYFRRKRWM